LGGELAGVIDGVFRRPNLYNMEDSAVLQVCNANNVPAVIIRAVSDTVEGEAAEDFNAFIDGAVDNYVHIVNYMLKNLNENYLRI
jgi:adenosylhomocysteine nucleosidase